MQNLLRSKEDLRSVYSNAPKAIEEKALSRLEAHSRRFIELSPFFCIGSTGPDGLGDVSPRGGEPGFVHVLSYEQLAFPDRPGNNRLDTLTNITHAPGIGMLFFIPGVEEMLRINGVASISTEKSLLDAFIYEGRLPRSVIQVHVREVYLHCTKALKRSSLWNPASWPSRTTLPSFGKMIKDQYKTMIPAKVLDLMLARDAKKNLY